ncbi:MAG: phage protein Gp27 family protein, partial [Pseudomonadales bacterium]
MPPRSKVAALPPEVKAWLDQSLVESNFGGYEQLSAELELRGYSIGKSALHRYGSEFE